MAAITLQKLERTNSMQTVFAWFEDSLNRSGVLSLCVFRPEVIKDKGYAGDKVTGGQHESFAYSTWLKFYTPLSHSVNTFVLES